MILDNSTRIRIDITLDYPSLSPLNSPLLNILDLVLFRTSRANRSMLIVPHIRRERTESATLMHLFKPYAPTFKKLNVFYFNRNWHFTTSPPLRVSWPH